MPSVKDLQLELDRIKALSLNPPGMFEGAAIIDTEAREKILADSATTSKMGQKLAKAWTFDRYGAFETEFTAKRVTPRKPDVGILGGLYYTELSALIVYRAYLARTYADRLIEVDSKIKGTVDSWGAEIQIGEADGIIKEPVFGYTLSVGAETDAKQPNGERVVGMRPELGMGYSKDIDREPSDLKEERREDRDETVDGFEQPQPDYMKVGNAPAPAEPTAEKPKRKPATKKAA